MKYFITGATGFIGGRVARLLIEAGHEVRALVRSPAKAPELAEQGITLVAGDITDKASLREPMAGVDGVFHLAGWYKVGVRDTRLGQQINVDGTRNVLETMGDLGIPKGVYTSTLVIFGDTQGRVVDESYRQYGRWITEYDRTKWVAHHEVAEPLIEQGLPLVMVLPGSVYGPGDQGILHNTLVEYLHGRLLMAPARTAYCWCHVEDTARAHVQAMEHGTAGESYIIGGPIHTVVDVLAMAQEITGRRAPRIHPPPSLLKLGAAAMSVVERAAPVPELYAAEALRFMAGVTILGDDAKARRELGFRPRPLREGLRETLQYEMQALKRRSH